MQRSESSLMSRLKWELVKNSRDYRYRAIELFLLLLEDLPMVRDYRLAAAFQWLHAVWCTDPVRVVTPTGRLRCSSLGDFKWPAGFQGGQPRSIGPCFGACLEASLLICFVSLLACLDNPGDLWHAYLGFHGWHEDTVPGGLDSAP